MTKIHGILATPEGKYVKVTLQNQSNGWELRGSDTWDFDNNLKKYLLLGSTVTLGIDTHWIRTGLSDNQTYAMTSTDNVFTACTQQAHFQAHLENLEQNLSGVYPDDVYLCTLPVFFFKRSEASFISVFEEERCWKTGIIIDKKLFVTYSVPKSEPARLSSFIARIERYWPTLKTGVEFPKTAFIFNKQTVNPGDHFDIQRLRLPVEDLSIIKACGIAFCNIDTSQPSLYNSIKGTGFRNFRSLAFWGSGMLIFLTLLLFAALSFLNTRQQDQIAQYESSYRKILTENNEIKGLFSEGDSLAEKLTRIEKFSSNSTRWGQFLHLLGTARPAKLYFEHLGSEPVKGTNNKIRVLLSGWAENETIVTELIKNINASELISNTSLSSMERDEKQRNFCKFKILCTLVLSKS